jgi:predicted nucleic-acid-binding protein
MTGATTMTIKGQVTVPREIRDRLGLKSGDKMGTDGPSGSHRNTQCGACPVTIAFDTRVLVRLLVRDDEARCAAAQRLVDHAAAAEEPVLIVLGTLLETGWVLRSRYKLDKASIAGAFTALLESADVEFEHPPTVEEALYVWAQHPGAAFADCVLNARAAHLGRSRFLTFDAGQLRKIGSMHWGSL